MAIAVRPPIRLVIRNDFPIVILGLRAIFASRPDRFVIIDDVVGGAGLDTQGAGNSVDADVVLLDPFASALPLAARVPGRTATDGCKYVILTWNSSPAAMAEAFELGYAGYLSKRVDDTVLIKAVEDIQAGQRVVLPPTQPARAASLGDWPGKWAGLTTRESEVLCLVGYGLTNREIAARAFIGEESLKAYIRSAYRKIGVTRRSQAIVWCFQNGLRLDGPMPT